MGAVGRDSSGAHALEALEAIGISTEFAMESSELATAMNTILVTPDGERTMIGARGANVAYRNVVGWDSALDWLHISGYALMEGAQQGSAQEAIRIARSQGIKLSMDLPSGVGGRIREVVEDNLSDFTVVAGSAVSLREIAESDQPIEALLDRGVSRVAMTSGANPMVLADDVERISLTPPRVDPIDATGGGDALVAGLIAATLAGLGIGPSAVLGAAAGAAATLVTGASQTLKDPESWRYLFEPGLWADADPEWLGLAANISNNRHDGS
jgi:sugar/nucleoside kinase (ribokinase family)